MKAILYGAGRLGFQIHNLIKYYFPDRYEILGFIDDVKAEGTAVVDGLQVIGDRVYLINNFEKCKRELAVFICVGYSDLGKRYEIYKECSKMSFSFPNLIHPLAHVEKSAQLGSGNILLPGAVIDHNVKIGDINFIDINVAVSHDNTIGSNNFFTINVCTAGFVVIGDSNFFGMQATITNDLQIGNHNFLYARAFLTRSITDNNKIITNLKSTVLEEY